MTITRYTFETGADNANMVTGEFGTSLTSSSFPQYETAAAFSSSLIGIECTSTQWAQWNAPATNWSGSVYARMTVNPGTGNDRIVTLMASGVNVAALRFNATGSIQVVNGANVIVDTVFGSTWVAGDEFRFDWQISNSAGVITWQIRIFKNAAIEAFTPTETVSRSITAAAPTAVQIGNQTSGSWNLQFDNVALSNVLEWIGPYAGNVRPIADAGPDQLVNSGASVTLTGAGSVDTDGSIVAYAWTQISGYPTVALSGTGATRTFTAPRHLGGTALEFQLTVTDDDGAIDTDTVVITVNTAGTVTRYGFETGPEGAQIIAPVGGNSGQSVPLTPTFRAAANFHSSLFGVRAGPVVDSNQGWLGFTTAANSAGSVYFRTVAASATTGNRVIAFNSATANIAGITQRTDNTFMVDAATVIVGLPSTTTWTPIGTQFRVDWDISYAGLTATMRVRLFKGAAIDSDTHTEELIRTFTVTEVADQVRIGARNIGWTIEYDDLSLADAVGFIGPNIPPVVAYAGGDQSVTPWSTVTLNGTGSVGAITSYTWTQISGTPTVVLGGTGGIRTFEAPSILGGTTLGFRVSATDGVTTDTDDVLINIASGDEFYLNAAGAWRPQRTDWL